MATSNSTPEGIADGASSDRAVWTIGLDTIDGIDERLAKASGILQLICSDSKYGPIMNAAWAAFGLIDEAKKILDDGTAKRNTS